MKFHFLPTLVALTCAASAFPAMGQQAKQSYIVQVSSDSFANESPDEIEPDERHLRQPTIWKNHNPKMARFLRRLESAHGFKAKNLFSHAINGFAALLNPAQIEALSKLPGVVIEKDLPIRTNDWSDTAIGGQKVPWGLIATAAYQSSARSGANVSTVSFDNTRLYVIDSGVAPHSDLNIEYRASVSADPNVDDCHGHGTQVAGIAAAINNDYGTAGTAPGLPITSVKVVDGCSGEAVYSATTQAVDAIYYWESIRFQNNPLYGGGVVVISMSGPGNSLALKNALTKLATPATAFKTIWTPFGLIYLPYQFGGDFIALSAGNSYLDACYESPAFVGGDVAGVLTVGAVNNDGRMVGSSNVGRCVKTWGPGNGNYTTTLNNGYMPDFGGTSAAAPHIAGIAALIRQTKGQVSPAEVANFLTSRSLSTGFNTPAPDNTPIRIPQATSY